MITQPTLDTSVSNPDATPPPLNEIPSPDEFAERELLRQHEREALERQRDLALTELETIPIHALALEQPEAQRRAQ